MSELSDNLDIQAVGLATHFKGHKQVHRAEDPLAKEARVSKGPLG